MSDELERYLALQLGKLSLDVPDEDVEFMARFIEEEGEREDKVEGVRGMIEGVVGDLPEGLDAMLNGAMDEWDRIVLSRAPAEPSPPPSASPSPEPDDPLAALSEKEIAKLHAMRYAYADADPAELAAALDAERGDVPRCAGQTEAQAKKAADERRAQLEAAIRMDGKKKKHRKNQEVDLLAPNLNKDKVQYRAQVERENQKKAAQTVRDRDKAALDKQRADAAKAKADKQKKAQKGERRA